LTIRVLLIAILLIAAALFVLLILLISVLLITVSLLIRLILLIPHLLLTLGFHPLPLFLLTTLVVAIVTLRRLSLGLGPLLRLASLLLRTRLLPFGLLLIGLFFSAITLSTRIDGQKPGHRTKAEHRYR